MQKSLFENQNIVEALNSTLRICNVSGSFSSITYKQAVDFLLPRHYSGRKPSITFSFGYFENNELKAVCTFGKPASNSLCIGVCGKEYSEKVFELNRLCVDGEIEIQLSKFVAWCLNELKAKDLILVSYADSQMNHNGYIYQATNWIYTGMTKARTDKYVEGGKHSRHYDNEKQNGLRKYRSAKHRYIYFATSKTKRKEYMKKLNYQIEPYPKGENKKYELGTFIEPIVINTNASYNCVQRWGGLAKCRILGLANDYKLNIITIGERQNMKNRRTEILVTNYKKPLSLFDGLQ